MVDILEESAPAEADESAPAVDLNPPADLSSPVSLENALNNSEAGRTKSGSPASPDPRAGGMMPQGSLLKIPVNVQVILGTTRMPLHKVMSLGPGSIVALDKELSEPVTLLVNGNEVARGLIVVVNEKTGQLGISLTEVSSGGPADKFSKPI
ncbi:MAG: FliM/FliN family flagellar motor switch protein [Aestuariivirga sp.]